MLSVGEQEDPKFLG